VNQVLAVPSTLANTILERIILEEELGTSLLAGQSAGGEGC